MNNTKGFTLAELLAVLVILALVALIALPAISDVIEQQGTKLCASQLNLVIEDARIWGADNMEFLPTDNGSSYDVSLETLMEYGYISEDLVNPKTGTAFDENWAVRITRNNKTYDYTIYDMDQSLTIDIDSYCED